MIIARILAVVNGLGWGFFAFWGVIDAPGMIHGHATTGRLADYVVLPVVAFAVGLASLLWSFNGKHANIHGPLQVCLLIVLVPYILFYTGGM